MPIRLVVNDNDNPVVHYIWISGSDVIQVPSEDYFHFFGTNQFLSVFTTTPDVQTPFDPILLSENEFYEAILAPFDVGYTGVNYRHCTMGSSYSKEVGGCTYMWQRLSSSETTVEASYRYRQLVFYQEM